MKSICRSLGWVMIVVLVLASPAVAKQQGYGTISGVVLDPSGTPQMGASIWLISEDAGGRTVAQILSNQHGAFLTDHLKPGEYAVRVSVAGFLPAMERHVAVMSNLTTLLRVQVKPCSLRWIRYAGSPMPLPNRTTGSGCCALLRRLAQSCSGVTLATRSRPIRWALTCPTRSAPAPWCR